MDIEFLKSGLFITQKFLNVIYFYLIDLRKILKSGPFYCEKFLKFAFLTALRRNSKK